MMKEVSKVIMLVEDRIAEILESGDLEIELTNDGLLTEKHLRAVEKMRFLRGLSKDLFKFDIGRY